MNVKHKFRNVTIALGFVIILSFTAYDIVHAAKIHHHESYIGSSGISKVVYRQQRLIAMAQTLDTTTQKITTAHKDHTFLAILKTSGLNKAQFNKQLKQNIKKDLEAKGYSSDQITIAFQQLTIHHLHRQLHHR